MCGSFSGWEPVALHRATAGGDFVRSLALPPGPAYFKYLVDGDWICSPCEQVVANGKGYNNHRWGRGAGSGRGGWCASCLGPLQLHSPSLAPLLPSLPPPHLLASSPLPCSLTAG